MYMYVGVCAASIFCHDIRTKHMGNTLHVGTFLQNENIVPVAIVEVLMNLCFLTQAKTHSS